MRYIDNDQSFRSGDISLLPLNRNVRRLTIEFYGIKYSGFGRLTHIDHDKLLFYSAIVPTGLRMGGNVGQVPTGYDRGDRSQAKLDRRIIIHCVGEAVEQGVAVPQNVYDHVRRPVLSGGNNQVQGFGVDDLNLLRQEWAKIYSHLREKAFPGDSRFDATPDSSAVRIDRVYRDRRLVDKPAVKNIRKVSVGDRHRRRTVIPVRQFRNRDGDGVPVHHRSGLRVEGSDRHHRPILEVGAADRGQNSALGEYVARRGVGDIGQERVRVGGRAEGALKCFREREGADISDPRP